MTGDPEKVRPFLAPEYQVQRSDGKGYDKEGYLALSIPKIAAIRPFATSRSPGTATSSSSA